MTISRRSLLTVVPAGFAAAAARAAGDTGACRGQRPEGRTFHRQARCQGNGRRIFLTHLHPLCRLRRRHLPRDQEKPDRHRRSSLGVPRLPARSGRAHRLHGRALSAGRSLRAVRQRPVRHPEPLGIQPRRRPDAGTVEDRRARRHEPRHLRQGARRHRPARLDPPAAEGRFRSIEDRTRLPSFVINGQKYAGEMSYDAFRKLIPA